MLCIQLFSAGIPSDALLIYKLNQFAQNPTLTIGKSMP